MQILYYIFTIIVGYLIGSLNFSIIIGKLFYKTDVRQFGSKNAGATNTLRTLGTKAGIIVFLLDTLKAVIVYFLVSLMSYIVPYGGPVAPMLSATAASIGHNYPVFFGFKGGKGVTVSLGAVCCFNPLAGILTLTIGVIVIAISKFVSLGSMTAAFVSPFLTYFLYNGDYKVLAVILNIILALQIIVRHKKNIGRLMSGTESKISFSKKEGK